MSTAESLGKLRPNSLTIWLKQSKIREKVFLRDNGFPVPNFMIINSPEDVDRASSDLGGWSSRNPRAHMMVGGDSTT